MLEASYAGWRKSQDSNGLDAQAMSRGKQPYSSTPDAQVMA